MQSTYPSSAIEILKSHNFGCALIRFHEISYVITPIKNLGWLRRNWKKVSCFFVYVLHDGKVFLVATLKPWTMGNRTSMYVTEFASESVLYDFLNRPVFRGLNLYKHGEKYSIGINRPALSRISPVQCAPRQEKERG